MGEGDRPGVKCASDPDEIEPAKAIVAANLTRLMRETPKLRTVKQLAAKSGVGTGTVDRIRRGESAAGVDTLHCLAEAFGLKAWQLLLPDGAPAAPPPGFADRRQISVEDWALLEAVRLLVPPAEIEALLGRAARFEQSVRERLDAYRPLRLPATTDPEAVPMPAASRRLVTDAAAMLAGLAAHPEAQRKAYAAIVQAVQRAEQELAPPAAAEGSEPRKAPSPVRKPKRAPGENNHR